MKRRSLGWTFKRNAIWYIGYFRDWITEDGRKVRCKKREAVGPRKSDATARLAQRLRELDDGKWQDPTHPLTFDDLLALFKADWRKNSKKETLYLPHGNTELY